MYKISRVIDHIGAYKKHKFVIFAQLGTIVHIYYVLFSVFLILKKHNVHKIL